MAVYALNLNFDPDGVDGTFQPYDSSDNSGRAWAQSATGGPPWSFAGNPDTWAPELSLDNGDKVQFAVSPISGSSLVVKDIKITVVFARDRNNGNNPAKIASPFQLPGGTPQCLLRPPPGTWGNWYLIGPLSLAINTNNSGKGKLKFEFSIVAHVDFTDNSHKEYGYDPEMDVDV